MILTLDKERFDETVERFIREAETRIDDYTHTAARKASRTYTRLRKASLVQRMDSILKSQFNSYGKRKYVRRSHDLVCDCTWNPQCNPSIRKFYEFMMDESK